MSLMLKIRWTRIVQPNQGPSQVADEHLIFIPCERVDVHGVRGEHPRLDSWDEADYASYVSITQHVDDVDNASLTTSEPFANPRLIATTDSDGATTYWLVSEAWILGPDGGTIERVAP